ncbi:MAG: hypothetical protein ABR564_08740 [Candidatus Dormibacteria bacterium]
MPVDADALDQIALGVTQSLARSGRPERQTELDEHARLFTSGIASVKAVFTLADSGRDPEVRGSARDSALADLFMGLARRGRLSAALKQVLDLSRPESPEAAADRSSSRASGDAPAAGQILTLFTLARSGRGEADEATVSRAVEDLIAQGTLAAELRWLVTERAFSHDQLAGWLHRLGRSTGRRLSARLREDGGDKGGDGYPFIARTLAGTALADAGGASRQEPQVAAAEGSHVAGRVDSAVRSAARSAPTLAAYRAMRAARRQLDDEGWAAAVRRLDEGTTALVALVVELLTSGAGHAAGWDRWAVEKRIESVAARQERILATLPGLRAEYNARVDAYLASEGVWKRVFRDQVLDAAVSGGWDGEAMRYLGAEYPQLSIGLGDMPEAQVPEATEVPAVAAAAVIPEREGPPPPPPPPPSTTPGRRLPRAPTPPAEAAGVAPGPAASIPASGVPAPTPSGIAMASTVPAEAASRERTPPSGVERPTGRDSDGDKPAAGGGRTAGRRRLIERRPIRLPFRSSTLLAALAPAAAVGGLLAGYGVGGPGPQAPRPPTVPSGGVTTAAAPAPLPGNHVVLHLRGVTARDGTTLGPYDETDGAGTVECSAGLMRLLATTMTGLSYEVRGTPVDTVLSFAGARASLSGPAPPTYGSGIAEGRVPVASSADPVGTVTVQGACPGASGPQVSMARTIPPNVGIDAVPASIRLSLDPGIPGMVAGLALMAAGVALILVRLRPDLRLVFAPITLLVGGTLLGFSAHRAAVAGDPAPVIPVQARTPGCADCPDGIRLASTEVQPRAGGDLFIFRGTWPVSPDEGLTDLRLAAGELNVVLRPRRDPRGFQVVSATRADQAVPVEQIAVGLRPGALLIQVPRAAVPRPLQFEFGVWKGGAYAGRIPPAGSLVWDGRGAPRPLPGAVPNPSGSPAPAASPPAAATPASPSPGRPASPQPSPSPGAAALDLTKLSARCPALKTGKLPDDITPVNIVAGTVPDLVTSAPAHYVGVYFSRGGFGADLAGRQPFSVTVTVQRGAGAGVGSHAIDRVGNIQLWAYWDGRALHRGSRAFAAGAWTMRQDDAATDLPSVEVRHNGLVFYWNGGRPGDQLGTVASDGRGCSSFGISDQGAPAVVVP